MVQYDISRAKQRPGETRPLEISKGCAGFPQEPTRTNLKCYSCLFDDEKVYMQTMRPQTDALQIKREGAGNDNWGYSSQHMTGFGNGGSSSWLDQYDNQVGGIGTYLGVGKFMPDRREQRNMITPQARPFPYLST